MSESRIKRFAFSKSKYLEILEVGDEIMRKARLHGHTYILSASDLSEEERTVLETLKQVQQNDYLLSGSEVVDLANKIVSRRIKRRNESRIGRA